MQCAPNSRGRDVQIGGKVMDSRRFVLHGIQSAFPYSITATARIGEPSPPSKRRGKPMKRNFSGKASRFASDSTMTISDGFC
jgi:hypothetical protein